LLDAWVGPWKKREDRVLDLHALPVRRGKNSSGIVTFPFFFATFYPKDRNEKKKKTKIGKKSESLRKTHKKPPSDKRDWRFLALGSSFRERIGLKAPSWTPGGKKQILSGEAN